MNLYSDDHVVEERLNYLKKNIYKALPNTRLESKTDSLAYNRYSDIFKKDFPFFVET